MLSPTAPALGSGLGSYWQQVVKGIVLLAAVYVDVSQKNKG